MFRPSARRIVTQGVPRSLTQTAPSRRFLSTAPPHAKSRSWKNSAARWTLAGALVYYYNTSNVFAEEPRVGVHVPPETQGESELLPTLDAVAAERQAQARALAERQAKEASQDAPSGAAAPAGSPADLEEEAGQQGAFNEETGEINWDCPCLGGMAHGPCGEEFRDAFSCFVYSKEEPKGVDCIDKFKTMQNCFRAHPDVYGSELEDDEVEAQLDSAPGTDDAAASSQKEQSKSEKVAHSEPDHPEVAKGKQERALAATEQVKTQHGAAPETDALVPKAWHDAREEGAKK